MGASTLFSCFWGKQSETTAFQEDVMRIERSISTVSWIPSDLLEGMGKMATRMKMAHHDPPPPDSLAGAVSASLEELRASDRFRFANELRAFIDVDDDGTITGFGQT
jgi:hypothetical protein